MTVTSPERSLAEVAGDFAAGRATPQELHEAFSSATVFSSEGERPGFVAVGPPGDGFIPVFSSEGELARARGPVKWFSTTGADLFGLLPDGYDLILDSAGPAPLRLNPAAVRGTAAAETDRRLAASFAQDPLTPATLGALISRVGGDRYRAYIDHPFPSDTDDDVQALLDAYLRADPEGRAYILINEEPARVGADLGTGSWTGGTSLDFGEGAVSEGVWDRVELGRLETCPVSVLHIGRRVQWWDGDLAGGIRESGILKGR